MTSSQRSKNLDALEQLYPGIKKLIEERKEELLKKEQLDIERETSLEGETILKVKKDNRTLYLAGKRSAAGPAKNQIGLLGKIEATSPVFMTGLGNPHYLEELLKATDDSVMILIYEPSFTIFWEIIDLIDVKALFGHRIIALCVQGINEEGYMDLVRSMLVGDRIALMKHFILPNYEVICPEQVRDTTSQLTKYVERYFINVNTGIRFSEVKVDNIFHNADYVRTGYKAKQLQAVLPLDIPAIVVAAGPSLNKNINELKKAKNKAFIIAVDTAIKPLLNAGIVPDMFAIVDGLKPLSLIEMEECKEIPLITTLEAAKSVLDYHTGMKFFYNEDTKYINYLYEMNDKALEGFIVGGSVATLAFSLVGHLGFQTIIMVGQDLAYTGNKSHADGTFEDKMQELDTSKYKMVEGNCEELVPTDSILSSYREWFEEFIEFWNNRGVEKVRFINATEGGAKIKGTEIMPLKDVIEQECTKTVDIAGCFAKLEPVFTKAEQDKILQFFHDTPKQFHQIALWAKEGQKIYKSLDKMCSSGNVEPNGYVKLLKKIKKIIKKMEGSVNFEMISETMSLADQIIKTGQYKEYASFEEEGLEIAEKGMQYMELVERCADMFEELSAEAFKINEI